MALWRGGYRYLCRVYFVLEVHSRAPGLPSLDCETSDGYPAECVHELFQKKVSEVPHAVALIQGNQRLTYAELDRQANQVAHYLRKRGVGPEVLVGIFVEQSFKTIAALMGILKAGG
ncbi:MAG: non-ribosomal peptide synthetase, partial [Bryobacterales bacterium]|nr:non-ribosomal peptide synthetase [Bryobacterales bacterium]